MNDILKHDIYDNPSVYNSHISILIHKELAQIIKTQAEIENKTVNLLLSERFHGCNI